MNQSTLKIKESQKNHITQNIKTLNLARYCVLFHNSHLQAAVFMKGIEGKQMARGVIFYTPI